jgi:branched-chain amino acid transport system substrate-binding protein
MKHIFATTMAVIVVSLASAQALAGEKAIRIGILGDQSGPYAELGGPGSVLAAQMAVDDYGGKALGKPIQIISADTQNKPDIASAIAGRWFDVEGIDAIADLPVTSVALAVQSIAYEKKKVLMITGAASADLTGRACSPYTVHWMDDTRALSVGTARAVVAAGGKTWFFLTPDYAFGHAMERAATEAITASGGSVLGSVKFPLGTLDYSSFLLGAGSSAATIFGLSSVGGDTVRATKQAAEWGLTQGNRKIVVFLMFLPEVHAIGLAAAHGLYVTDGFYWDESEQARAWSRRFFASQKKMPSKSQANTYAAVMHYLKSLDAAKSDDAASVSRQMKSAAADYFGRPASIRENGRVAYDLTVYEVKSEASSKYPWDYYEPVRKVTAEEAFGPDDAGPCVRK